MKKSLGLSFLLCFFILTGLRSQVIDWVKPYEGEIPDISGNTDASGNKYVLEEVQDTVTWFTIVYLTKYNTENNVLWKVLLSEVNYNSRGKVKIDKDGNIVVINVTDYYSNLTVLKYSPAGIKLFESRTTHGYGSWIFPENVTLDKDNNIFVTGSLMGIYRFGPYVLTTPVVWKDEYWTNYGEEVFVVKLSSNGQFKWAKISRSSYNYGNRGIYATTDNLGNVYIAGNCTDQITFQGKVINGLGSEIFLVKYDSTGNRKYAYGVGAAGDEFVDGLYSDGENNVYLAGHNDRPGSVYSYYLENWTVKDSFLIKFSPAKLTHPISHRVNAGGPEISVAGKVWEKDYQTQPSIYLDAFSSNNTTGSFYSWTGVNNTGAPKALFGTNRYDVPEGGDLSYNFPLDSGAYKLSLFFAEKPQGVNGPEQRIFSINAEGQTILADYDIYANAGLNADVKYAYVKVRDGVLDLDFIRQVGNPQINGIEIVSVEQSSAAFVADQGAVPVLREGLRYHVTGVEEDALIISSNDQESRSVTFKVYDAQGKLVYDDALTASEGQFRIDTKLFAGDAGKGLYIISIDNEESIKVIK